MSATQANPTLAPVPCPPPAQLTAQEQQLLHKLASHIVSPAHESDFEVTLDHLEQDLLWELEKRKLVQLGWNMTTAGRAAFMATIHAETATNGNGNGTGQPAT